MPARSHSLRLPRRPQHPLPQIPVRVQELALAAHHAQRHVREVLVPVPDHQVGAPRQPGVHRVLPEREAVLGIERVGGQAADRVRRVDVLHGVLEPAGFAAGFAYSV